MSAATLSIEMLHRFTRQEYDQLVATGVFEGQRVELLHGVILQMSPHSPVHDGLLRRLSKVLTLAVRDTADVRVQMAFALSDDSQPEPDLAVVPPGDELDDRPSVAFLLVEVAWASLDYDRDQKGPAYAAAGVPEYWIVDAAGARVLRFTQPGPTGYARQETLDASGPIAVPGVGVTVDLSALFVR